MKREETGSATLGRYVSVSQALQCLVVAVAGWINQQQRDVIDYLQEENRVLREQRLSFRDVEDLLAQRGITVTYETIRRWTIDDIRRVPWLT